MRCVLTQHAERGTLAVVDAASFDAPSTSQAAAALAGFGAGKALIVLSREGEEAAVKSFRNLSGVLVLPSDAVGVADVIAAARLVVSDAALERLTSVARAPERRGQEVAA
jgi:large subunit ribosomal protein L4